ncbi:MAG: IS21 family transposase [Deltaproteobacteria bacterium]|nr:IS21 family transposase [Deltaproteobacteria bacterium]
MTLPLDVVTRIRRLHFAEHWKVGTIAAQLGVHHEAVRHAIGIYGWGEAVGARVVRESMVQPWLPFIRGTLEQYPRLTATRVHEMVRARGYQGSVMHLRRYVRMLRPQARREAFFRVEALPGEEAQVDWGLFGKVAVGNAQRSLCCFVMVLSYSRAVYAHFALDMSMESFLRGHVGAFEAFGGVARSILYDNLKSVVLERNGDAVRFNPRLLELAGHYHFAPKPCAPYRGNEKGKVERTIRYLRDSFFAARRFNGVADLNQQLGRWLNDTAMQRPWPGAPNGKRVHDMLGEERPKLLPLPAVPASTDRVSAVASGKTPYVRFDGNDYSLPPRLLRKPLTLVATVDTVRLLDGCEEVARHERSYDRGRRVEDRAHLDALAGEKRRGADLRAKDVLRTALRNAPAFLEALVTRSSSLAHDVARLVRLLERYGARELDAALEQAMGRGAISVASVAHLLDEKARRRKQPPPIDVVVPESVRHVRVTPHALADYDSLSKKDGES